MINEISLEITFSRAHDVVNNREDCTVFWPRLVSTNLPRAHVLARECTSQNFITGKYWISLYWSVFPCYVNLLPPQPSPSHITNSHVMNSITSHPKMIPIIIQPPSDTFIRTFSERQNWKPKCFCNWTFISIWLVNIFYLFVQWHHRHISSCLYVTGEIEKYLMNSLISKWYDNVNIRSGDHDFFREIYLKTEMLAKR